MASRRWMRLRASWRTRLPRRIFTASGVEKSVRSPRSSEAEASLRRCLRFGAGGRDGAEFQIGTQGEHAAAATEPVDVAAGGQSYGLGNCCRLVGYRLAGSGFGGCELRVGFGGRRDPSPCFDTRV